MATEIKVDITGNLAPGSGVTIPSDYKGQPIRNNSLNPITIFGTDNPTVLQPGARRARLSI
jgi:hypothetical protein